MKNANPLRTVVLTAAALLCFALNSLLCRAALGARMIDAWSFTLVRLVSGAFVLFLLVRGSGAIQTPSAVTVGKRVTAGLALFLYALPFSLAYVRISTGTGAFVVFGCVQITMIGSDFLAGRGLRAREALGLSVALFGLGWLTRPGVESPDPLGVLLMALSGFSWGMYSLQGRSAGPPLAASARNFTATLPLALVASALAAGEARWTGTGLLLATASGAITSGLGYVAWYAALPALTATRAAIVQLVVPPLAAFLGVILLGESVTPRLLGAAPLILGGIAVAVSGASRKPAAGK